MFSFDNAYPVRGHHIQPSRAHKTLHTGTAPCSTLGGHPSCPSIVYYNTINHKIFQVFFLSLQKCYIIKTKFTTYHNFQASFSTAATKQAPSRMPVFCRFCQKIRLHIFIIGLGFFIKLLSGTASVSIPGNGIHTRQYR